MIVFFKKSAKKRTPSYLRLCNYIQKAVAQDGVIEVDVLVDRFCEVSQLSVTSKTKDTWLKEIRKDAKAYGLYFFESLNKNLKKTEKVIKDREVPTKSYALKGNVYTDTIKKALIKRKATAVKVYNVLREAGYNSRTLERKVSKLKTMASQCGLEFFKKGKILMARLAKIVPFQSSIFAKNTPQKMEVPYYSNKLKRKERYKNTGKPVFRFNQSLNKKAHWLSKDLKSLFWDNCKVDFSYGTCYNFIKWALVDGFLEKDIKSSFDMALHKRHGDATDLGLNTQNYTLKFKVSSTVSLAKQNLLSKNANETRFQRIQNVLSFLGEKKKIQHQPQTEFIHNAPMTATDSKETSTPSKNSLPYPPVFEDLAFYQGFSKHQLSLFDSFLTMIPDLRTSFVSANPAMLRLFSSLAKILNSCQRLSA